MTDYSAYSRFWSPYDSCSLLDRHISERFAAALAAGKAARAEIRDEAALRSRQEYVRTRFLGALGLTPDDYPQPASSFATGTEQYPGYAVENVVIVPEPGVYITVNLYLPDAPGPHAAVLFLCGHAKEGKNDDEYMDVCRTLVSAGLAVLSMDPTGQGERLNYYDAVLKDTTVPPCTDDHDRAGCRGLVTGRSMAYWFLRDAMCAVSYLCSREDIDSGRIGVTGHSGGGTQTSMLMLADRRPAAFAPGTFIMSMGAMQRSGQAQDAEQIWQGFVADGCDHADILLSCAPKPVLVLAAEYDFFPKEGTDETVAEARRYWELCGRAEAFGCFTDAVFHCYSDAMQQEAARFFSRWLLGKEYGGSLLVRAEPERSLCTESGQTSAEYADFKRAAQLYCDYAAALPRRGDGEAWLNRVVHHSRRSAALNLRPLRASDQVGETRCTRWMWRTQEEMFGYGLLLAPWGRKTVPLTLAVWDGGTKATADHAAWIDEQIAAGRGVFVVDLAGEGQTEPYPVAPNAKLLRRYGTMYKLACDLLMLGDSLPALRIYDLLKALDAAEGLPEYDGGGLSVFGCGRSALYARLARRLDPRIQSLTCEGGVESYSAFLAEEPYDDEDILGHTLPGMLAYFD